MIDIENKTDFSFDEDLINAIGAYLCDNDLELLIVDDEEIKTLNNEYRGFDKATDVLSFPLEATFEGVPIGSIVISCDAAKRVAAELGHTPKEEFALLFIHGLLHLLGYDHEIDEGQMREKEAETIEKFALPQSLLVRSEG